MGMLVLASLGFGGVGAGCWCCQQCSVLSATSTLGCVPRQGGASFSRRCNTASDVQAATDRRSAVQASKTEQRTLEQYPKGRQPRIIPDSTRDFCVKGAAM